MRTADIVVIGAGIAGASAAYFLAEQARVLLLEREEQPGYHSTGRSAAIFHETYGRPPVRRLASASRAFLTDPPDGFAEHPLLRERGVLLVARSDQRDAFAEARALAAAVGTEHVEAARARALVPILREGYVEQALFEPGACDIDVHALHQGYLRGLRARGGELLTDAEVVALHRDGAGWRVDTSAGAVSTPVVVDAAGAWADVVGQLAGLAPLGLSPRRRTIITLEPPNELALDAWPMVLDVDEQFYFKPDAGRLLISPADETPRPPSDVQPDELDVALAASRFEAATTLRVDKIQRRWAGLRNFVADRLPVVGFDPLASGFFWLAGQGGAGIMTSPAMGRLVASLVFSGRAHDDLLRFGVEPAALAPDRLRARVDNAAEAG